MITDCLFLEEFSFISSLAPVVVLYWLFFKLLYSSICNARPCIYFIVSNIYFVYTFA